MLSLAMSRSSSHGILKLSWRSWLRWPGILLVNLVILLLVGVSTLRESVRTWTVDREILALESQANILEGRKFKLAQLAQELVSSERVELDARRRLGWKKDGEQVFVLSGYEAANTKPDEALRESSTVSVLQPVSNPRLWWRYFFAPGI